MQYCDQASGRLERVPAFVSPPAFPRRPHCLVHVPKRWIQPFRNEFN